MPAGAWELAPLPHGVPETGRRVRKAPHLWGSDCTGGRWESPGKIPEPGRASPRLPDAASRSWGPLAPTAFYKPGRPRLSHATLGPVPSFPSATSRPKGLA